MRGTVACKDFLDQQISIKLLKNLSTDRQHIKESQGLSPGIILLAKFGIWH